MLFCCVAIEILTHRASWKETIRRSSLKKFGSAILKTTLVARLNLSEI